MLFTEQEIKVLDLTTKGLNNVAISNALGISRNTVKTYKGRINRKLANVKRKVFRSLPVFLNAQPSVLTAKQTSVLSEELALISKYL